MKKLINWQIAGFVFTIITGTFFHFLFDLTNGSRVAALISPVNESIWEHIKLLFFPMFVYALLEYYFWDKEYAQFWCIKWKCIFMGIVLIPTLYYTYTGIIGKSLEWLNIVIFFGVAGAVYFMEYKMFLKNKSCKIPPVYAFVMLCIVGILFFIVTFYPPNIPLFQDPVNKTYGFWESLSK